MISLQKYFKNENWLSRFSRRTEVARGEDIWFVDDEWIGVFCAASAPRPVMEVAIHVAVETGKPGQIYVFSTQGKGPAVPSVAGPPSKYCFAGSLKVSADWEEGY